MCYHSKFGRSYSKLQRRWGFPKCAWGCWGLAPFVMWGVADPWEHVTPMHILCYTKLRRSRSVRFGVGRVPKIWGRLGTPLGMGTLLTPRNMLLPSVLPCQIQSVCVKQLWRTPKTFWPFASRLSRHSGSLDPTRIGRVPVTVTSYICDS